MMEPVFKRSEFSLCDVPVPEGYPQSQTHAGVGILSNGQFLLTTSPYPSIRYNVLVSYLRAAIRRLSRNRLCNHLAEYFENPCIYIGDSDYNHPPVKFKLAHSSPLMSPLDPVLGFPAFNSDPDIFIENDIVFVLNRSIYRMQGLYNYYMRLYLIEGTIVNGFFMHSSTILLREGKDIVGSQCLTSYKGKYLLMDVVTNSYNDGQTYNGIRYISSNTIAGLKGVTDWKFVNHEVTEMLPWHMSLFIYKDKLFTIIACVKKGEPRRCWQMLGMFSEDLSELKIFERPLTDYNSYRGAAQVCDNGIFSLYSTTVHEKVKGSSSVDGRNVILATRSFEEVLSQLSNIDG